MNNVLLDPYIFFKGDCREAMEFYKSVFGGELDLQTYADVGAGDNAPDGDPQQIMHARLEGGAAKLFGSDTAKASPKAAKISLALGGADEATLRPIFENLSDGGEVQQPLKKEFWGDIFGSLTDKYGVEWMVNIPKADD